jgi:uncharacterized iron-regulated protein
MLKKSIFIILICSLALLSFDKPAWKLYSKNGKKSDYKTMLDQCRKADIILFGEIHNNPIAHWLQIELAKDLNQDLILGAEFFETDNQFIVNEYLAGLIEYRHLKSEAKIWDNFETDYLPLVNFAKTNKLPFIATNIPRRYASIVARLGIDTLATAPIDLSNKHKMPELPLEINFELPGYKVLKEGAGAHTNITYIAEAQALKDATMAKNILLNFKKDHIFFHINGAYHSNNYEGIYWYLKKLNPDLKITTISTVEQSDINKLEKDFESLADFIIVTPNNMTKTY